MTYWRQWGSALQLKFSLHYSWYLADSFGLQLWFHLVFLAKSAISKCDLLCIGSIILVLFTMNAWSNSILTIQNQSTRHFVASDFNPISTDSPPFYFHIIMHFCNDWCCCWVDKTDVRCFLSFWHLLFLINNEQMNFFLPTDRILSIWPVFNHINC